MITKTTTTTKVIDLETKDDFINFSVIENPIVKVIHNNTSMYFLVDTGCDKSYIDEYIKDMLVLTPTNECIESIMCGDSDIEGVKRVYEMQVQIANHHTTAKVVPMDFKQINKAFKDKYGIVLRGIIGSNFLSENAYVLDFKDNCIYIADSFQTELNFNEPDGE